VLSVAKDESLPEAFKLLVEQRILAVPVLGKAHRILGFVDMLDFAQFIITEARQRTRACITRALSLP
jgi:CBS-domain-containing membrane protein